MNKDFWKKLKLFASVVEEANDKIKEDKEMILAVCEEQLKEFQDNCDYCIHEDKSILDSPCNMCGEDGSNRYSNFESKN